MVTCGSINAEILQGCRVGSDATQYLAISTTDRCPWAGLTLDTHSTILISHSIKTLNSPVFAEHSVACSIFKSLFLIHGHLAATVAHGTMWQHHGFRGSGVVLRIACDAAERPHLPLCDAARQAALPRQLRTVLFWSAATTLVSRLNTAPYKTGEFATMSAPFRTCAECGAGTRQPPGAAARLSVGAAHGSQDAIAA